MAYPRGRQIAAVLALSLLAACGPVPRPPTPGPTPAPKPPDVYTFDVSACQKAARDGHCLKPIPGATVRVNTHRNPDDNFTQVTNADGYTIWTLPDVTGDASIFVTADGYVPYDSGTFVMRELTRQHNVVLLNAAARAWQPTRAQLLDLQGDLMIGVPELALTCDGTGDDPRAHIRCAGDGGATPRGLFAGWVWGLSLPRYGAEDRERIYTAALSAGHTHVQVAVQRCTVGDGYHGLYPETAETCATTAARVNTVLRELHAHRLVTMCVGVSPTDPVLDGLDASLCDVVGDDWDNSMAKDCRLDALARAFPGAPIFLWRLAGATTFEADGCSPSPFPATNAQWFRAAQQRVPAFVGMFHEVNLPEGVEAGVADLTAAHTNGYRDVVEVLGESDTYWKFWQALPDAAARAVNDGVLARLPWLAGCFSGCTTHSPPAAAEVGGGTLSDGDGFDLAAADVDAPAGFATWPIGARITQLDVLPSGFHFGFTASETWPNVTPPGWTGSLQYTVGVAFLVRGQWRMSVQIQAWRGLGDVDGVGVGGPVTTPSQFPTNWFYAPRGGALGGYTPTVGEPMGVVLCEGNCRDVPDGSQSPRRERSNVVVVPYPGPAGASFRR